MAYFYANSTSQNESDNSSDCSNVQVSDDVLYVVTCVTIAITIPMTLVAICACLFLVHKDHVAPIYVINLLISDLLQLSYMIISVTNTTLVDVLDVFVCIYYIGLMASVQLMVCVALERYLVVAWPLWYHFRRSIKTSLIVCGVIWGLSLAFTLFLYFCDDDDAVYIVIVVCFLFPYPVLIFSLCGTLKALSAATRLPPDEKRRIVALLVLVLLTYTLLFLPSIIWFMPEYTNYCSSLRYVSYALLQFSPFADSFLYILLRKGVVDNLLASLCCCSMETTDTSTATEDTVQNP